MSEISNRAWKIHTGDLPGALSITQVVCTIISDTVLVLLPIWIFRTAKLDSRLRVRLLAVCSISVAEILAGIAQAVVSSVFGGVSSLVCSIVKVTSKKDRFTPVMLTAFSRFLLPCLHVTPSSSF